ncbi:enoyl-CoA hydratase/isomerase family protein [Cupriavidus basilensis]
MNELEVVEANGVLSITLARPAKRNALTTQMVRALRTVLEEASRSRAVRTLLLCAEGAAFCAGRDLSDAVAGEDAAAILHEEINPLIESLSKVPQPTIAAVGGAAMGVGLGLALACDLVMASPSAAFASPFARLGGILDSGGHWLLARRIGGSRTFRMIATAEQIGGEDAYDWGMADLLVPDEELDTRARDWRRCSPMGRRMRCARKKGCFRQP